jgi:hypothetical protein
VFINKDYSWGESAKYPPNCDQHQMDQFPELHVNYGCHNPRGLAPDLHQLLRGDELVSGHAKYPILIVAALVSAGAGLAFATLGRGAADPARPLDLVIRSRPRTGHREGQRVEQDDRDFAGD